MSVTTGDGDLPDVLELEVGQVARLPLVGASGAGHRWRVQPAADDTDGAGAATIGVEVGAPPREDAESGGPPPSSTSAPEVLVVEARSPGVVEAELRLARAWAPDEPLRVHRLRVVVVAATTPG